MSTTLFDFTTAEEGDSWTVVNDGVMGGLSRSRFVVNDDSTATFSGVVSLENNGGFASVRTRPRDFGLGGCTHIRLRVRGDGNTYQLRLRLDDNFDGVAYQALFATAADGWQEVTLPIADFRPTFRGRTVRDAPPVDPFSIRQVGFLISEKQEGPFALQIDWIRADKK
jgi:monofunctional biosynthetic peptidoglycan transglycosylase